MKLILSLLILFLFASPIFSQNMQVEATLVADQEAIKMGQVTIFSLPDSTLRKGSYLDSSYFLMEFNPNGTQNYYLKVNVPNYLDTIIQFSIQENDTLVSLGTITLLKDETLETVEITFKKEMFVRTMDGISVNVEGTNLQTLTNLFEVLKASPKIMSPDGEQIEIIGRGSPLILVDRQAIISNDELKAIPASQIERIEIITNPSAKYKAQGSGNGVIEVYTKNFHMEGYNFTMRGSGGVNTQLKPSAGLNLGLSLKRKKFSLNGYMGANYNSSFGYGQSSSKTTDDSYRAFESTYNNESESIWQYYSVKAAYNISDKQRVSIGVNGHGSGWNSDNTSSSTFSENNIFITQQEEKSNSDNTWLNNSAFLNYTLETDTNNSNLEINFNYFNKVSNSNSQSTSNFEFLPTAEKTVFAIQNQSRDIPNIGELRINYEHNFDTTGWKLLVGGSYSALFNGKRFDQFNNELGQWVLDEQFSNSYDYREDIGGLYAELSKKWNKFGFKVGMRGEYTRLDGFSNSLNQQFMDSSYIQPFPSASLLYEANEKLTVTLFYKRGIDRPQFSNYDPFVIQSDSLSIEYGNPFLRPVVEESFGFEFDLFYAYNISISYLHRKDPISRISFIEEGSFLTETTPWNALAEDGISLSLSAPIQTKWLEGWNSVWVDYSKYSFTSIFEREPLFNFTYGIYSYLTFKLPQNFEISNYLNIYKWGGDETVNNAMLSWGLRATKKFKANQFQIFLDVDEIIPPSYKNTTYSGNYVVSSNGQYQFTTFKVGFFLKVGRLKAASQIQESSSGQSDRL